ncbi:hypothetical protein [Nonomuraea sp. NPDC049141]
MWPRTREQEREPVTLERIAAEAVTPLDAEGESGLTMGYLLDGMDR